MKALPNDRWRAACIAYIQGGRGPRGGSGGHNSLGYTAAYRAAGYEGTDEAARVSAYRMFHDARMQEAIQEESKRRLVSLLPVAMAAHEEILENPNHKDRLNAARSVFDRAGLHIVTEEIRSVSVTLSADDRAKAVMLAERLGVPLEKLLGNRLSKQLPLPAESPTVIDGDFTELPAPEPTPARLVRLEDIL